jgi:sulfur carrier protein
MLDVQLNGQAHRVRPRQTLAQLLDELDLPPQAMAVAVNRSVVPRARWDDHVLNAQDRIDIVRAIGGG